MENALGILAGIKAWLEAYGILLASLAAVVTVVGGLIGATRWLCGRRSNAHTTSNSIGGGGDVHVGGSVTQLGAGANAVFNARDPEDIRQNERLRNEVSALRSGYAEMGTAGQLFLKQLDEAGTGLAHESIEQGESGDDADEARAALDRGDTALAENFYLQRAEQQRSASAYAATDSAKSFRIAGVLAMRRHPPTALAHFDEAVRLAPNEVESRLLRGQVHLLMENWEGAKLDNEHVIEMTRFGASNGVRRALELRAMALGNLGIALVELGQPAQSLAVHRESLAIDEHLEREEGMADTYGNMGNALDHMGRWSEAIEMHGKSLRLSISIGRRRSAASAYGNIATLHMRRDDRGDRKVARELFEKSLDMYERLDDKRGVANCYENFGHLYELEGEPELAEEMFAKGNEVNQGLGA